MNVGKKIKKLRLLKKWSGNKLAKNSGLSQSAINAIEHGQKYPTTATLERICTALGISLSDFFAEEDPDLSPELRQLLEEAKELSPCQLEAIINTIKAMKK